MSHISTPAVAAATGAAAELFSRIKRMAGSVPNTYAAIGSLQPAALGAMLDAEAVLAAGSLSKQDIETVKLTVSAATGCGYCVAAHSLLGKLAGLRPDAIRNIREGRPTGDAKRDALAGFVGTLVKISGKSATSGSPRSRLLATPISSSSRSALLSPSSLSPTRSIASTTPISIIRR